MKTDDTFEPLRDAAQRAPALRLLLAVSLHMEKGLVVTPVYGGRDIRFWWLSRRRRKER